MMNRATRRNPLLILLHYFGGSARSWDAVIPLLAERGWDSLALDLPGFGPDSALQDLDDLTLQRIVGDVKIALQSPHVTGTANEIGYVLVGHSMGGKIALALAVERPADLRGLVLLAPSPPTPQPMDERERNQDIRLHGQIAAAEATFRKIVYRPDEAAKDVHQRFISDNLASNPVAWNWWLTTGSRDDISGGMAQIVVPTLVLSGDHDPVIGAALAEGEVVARLTHAIVQHRTIADSGHLLPLEQPEAVAEQMAQWLSQTLGRETHN